MSGNLAPSAMGRNHALAMDLEKLPLELIEDVLEGLNFEQAIRLSSWAGPQLTSALTISPSWRQHFGTKDDRTIWQKYLQLTDQVNVLCFDTRRDARTWFKKEQRNHWHYRREPPDDKHIAFLQDGPSSSLDATRHLRNRWLNALSAALQVGSAFFGHASFQDLEPSLPHEARQRPRYLKDPIPLNARKEDDIETAVRLYQGALCARRSSLVNELRRLAALYEAHPQLLKVPYAPQSSRPSVRHVPEQFRSRANKLEKAPPSFWTNGSGRTYFHHDFPALVPFDWTVRFLVSILNDEQEVDDKGRFLLDSLVRYYLRRVEPDGRQSVWTAGLPYSLSLLKPKQIGFLAGADGPKWFKNDGPLVAHSNKELDWLETFVKVVAGLIKKFPEAAKAAQTAEADPTTLIEQLKKSTRA